MPREAKKRSSVNYTAQVRELQPGNVSINATPVANIPQGGGDNEMLQLARSLERLAPSLGAYVAKKDEEFRVGEQARASRAFAELSADDVKASQKALRDLQHGGKILANENPWFRKYFREAQLRAQGMQYGQQLTANYQTSEVRTSDDPEVWTQFTSGAREALYEQLDGAEFQSEEIAAILNPMLDSMENSLYSQHKQLRAQEMIAANQQAFLSTAVQTALGYDVDNAATTVEALQEQADYYYQHGGTDGNKLMVDSLVQVALQTGDLSALDLMHDIKTGTGMLGGTAYAKEQAKKAEDTIVAQQMQMARFNDWLQDEAEEDANKEFLGGYYALLDSVDDPRKADPSAYLAQNPRATAEQRELVESAWRAHVTTQEYVLEDTNAFVALNNMLLDGTPDAQILKFANENVASGRLEKSRLDTVRSMLTARGQSGSSKPAILKDDLVENIIRGAEQAIKGSDLYFDQNNAMPAQLNKNDVIQWVLANQDLYASDRAAFYDGLETYATRVTEMRRRVLEDADDEIVTGRPIRGTKEPDSEDWALLFQAVNQGGEIRDEAVRRWEQMYGPLPFTNP